MEGQIRKRPFPVDSEDIDGAPKQKKARFPKGKKVKPGEEEKLDIAKILGEEAGEDINGCDLQNPRVAAKERAKRRNLITAQLFSEEQNQDSTAEITYEDNENFVEEGVQIEPFNLHQEREEGYFDAAGNFVEYVSEKEIKDAWLDSIAVDPRYAGMSSKDSTEDDTNSDANELSSADVGLIKKRIATVLQPGETVLQALRRLKGNSNNRKQKMPAETQLLFDKLTDDANKLLDQGEYNVYHDKQEVFQREADGYEQLALARENPASLSVGMGTDIFSDVTDLGATSSELSNSNGVTSNTNISAAETLNNGADEYDMFVYDEDDKPSSNSINLVSGISSDGVSQLSSSGQTYVSETGALQDDYVYDETSGYSYNQERGTYDEIQEVASGAN
ncbi:uncharacterized protein LOC126682111 isoform X2 [Mercurialis annua]|uniref:uncharacterized protein LOC126682111 isoform X2 n=1 Tax=Mercurialis annua TaxID=3986 RepID=UPI00215E33F2|nr:uncharacterized protein LOC126682111 isoform X2 [Mercurialis annua]